MAQDPRKAKNDGKIGMPRVDAGMNRIPPGKAQMGGKGSEEDKKFVPLGTGDGSDTKAKDDAKILTRSRKRFDICVSAESENRIAGVEDLKFKKGDQWPASIAAQRNQDNRPCMTVNMIPTFVNQVVNEQRISRPSINVSPVGDRSDPEVAKMYRGLIRYLERASHADVAYDTAFDSAASIGWGYWRTLTEYESPETLKQTITIKRIRNTFSVYMDPTCIEADGSDARYAFVTELMPRDEFEDTYPDADPMSWTDSGPGDTYKNWIDEKNVRVAEYFEIEHKKRTVVLLSNGHEGFEDELDDLITREIKAGRIKVLDEREAQVPKVMWYKMTGVEILEIKEWAGKWIPITRVVGNEIDIEGKVSLSGIIRNAKEPQRLKNYSHPVALDTPIPTPDGWTTMGEIKEGDRVFDETGAIRSVVGLSPIFINRECVRVNFADGTGVVTDKGHQWVVEELPARGTKVFVTKKLSSSEIIPKRTHINLPKALDIPDSELPIHPYFLGQWLGDGTSLDVELTPGDSDLEEVSSILRSVGLQVGPARKFPGREARISVGGLRQQFKALGLIGNKHVPVAYLRASHEQRLWLLRGLMDSDGTISKTRQCRFTTTKPHLAESFRELVRGLGFRATLEMRPERLVRFPQGYTSVGAETYAIAFTCGEDDDVFALRRKRDRQHAGGPHQWRRTKRMRIESVVSVSSVPVRCLTTDAPSHLFLVGEAMLPTHNTMMIEAIALTPKAPYIGAEGQFEGHEDMWLQANTKSYPYLEYRPTALNGTPVPPPQRQPPALPSQGWEQLNQMSAQDMMGVTGIRFDSTKQERVSDESGRALRELRHASDMGSFHYYDNLCRSLKHQGDILIDLIPRIIDTKRMVTILREDDTEEQVQIDPRQQKPYQEGRHPMTGKVMKIFNPTYGKYGVTVTIGPSYATKRIEAAESMMDFVRALPQTAQFVADLVAKNQDWPEAEQIATRLAKMLPPNLLAPDMKDVPPQLQALLQGMDQQVKQLTQELMMAQKALTDQNADRAIEVDKISKDFEAKVLKIVADIETKTAATQEKATANFNTHIGAQIAQLGEGVTTLIHAMENGAKPNGTGRAAE